MSTKTLDVIVEQKKKKEKGSFSLSYTSAFTSLYPALWYPGSHFPRPVQFFLHSWAHYSTPALSEARLLVSLLQYVVSFSSLATSVLPSHGDLFSLTLIMLSIHGFYLY